ncbi:Activator of stress genes 1 [Talaromyces islandicus]|uniref:Activator of stress genes 1 n=1 Tax=Talaromyces islandicus TaxID=28573 RepID=A0A0U1LN53_TALIS|nr:Activator of stress genes 1 [Talaromyces islandicus]
MTPPPRDSHGPDDVHNGPPTSNPRPVRRRNRMITSCLECRRRKLKCDRLHPCTNCSRGKRDCLFLAPSLDSVARLKLTELKERVGSLERSLGEEVAGTTTNRGSSETSIDSTSDWKKNVTAKEEEPTTSLEYDGQVVPEPSRLAVMDAAYDDENDDEVADVGIQLGKMQVTDRLGGYVRPRIVDEASANLKGTSGALLNDDAEDGSELSKLLELASSGAPIPFLQPGPSFITPCSDMLLGPPMSDVTLFDLLPTRAAADKLVQRYWDACHPVARILHRQTFEKKYEILWESVSQGTEPPASIQAIVFATLFTAVVSMQPSEVTHLFGVDRQGLIESYQIGTETALGKAHFLRTSKTETLQAFVMYLIPMCRDTISRTHSALVGAAVRLAECMGMHRDPSEYGYGPVETHIRRLIWYQLCLLDLRTTETQGPRVIVRPDDFTTKLPLNINDADLMKESCEESTGWTDITLTRIRFECQEMLRVVITDRARLEKKEMSLTTAFGKIETFKKSMLQRYGPIVNIANPTPIQRAASVLMSFLLSRLPISLLHRWYNSSQKMPDRLTQIMIAAGAQQLEDAVVLETAPDLRTWSWYSRAYHNFHIAFLLLSDLSYHPLRREADRIWRCLDYVYEFEPSSLPQNPTRQEIIEDRQRKTHTILRQFRDRMHVYRTIRKIKHSAAVNEVKLGKFVPPKKPQEPQDTPYKPSDPQLNLGPWNLLPEISRNQVLSSHSRQGSGDQYQQMYGPPPSSSPLQNIQKQPSSIHSPYENILPLNQGFESPHGRNTLQPGFVQGSAHTSAPSAKPFAVQERYSPNSDDLPMLDIDWTEWDKMFPPHLNDGNIDLSPQSIYDRMPNSIDANILPATMYPAQFDVNPYNNINVQPHYH